jgi:medium-chain acyl-[acyl-carrier-protein] hydrolase
VTGTVRLLVFPFAGGSAGALRAWGGRLGPRVEPVPVLLPGRDSLFAEPSLVSHDEALEYVRRTVLPSVAEPFALYGHSMGARLAFEAARELRRLDGPAPLRLFVSGAPAPRFGPPPATGHLSDEAFVERLRQLAGTPEEVLANEELLAALLPRVRADFALAESYRYTPGEPLACPISVWGGTADVYPRERLEAWREETTGDFALTMLRAGHFFDGRALGDLLSGLRRDLERALVDRRGVRAVPGPFLVRDPLEVVHAPSD